MDFESPNVVVPSVQELAKDPNVVTVPQRYIRYDQTQIQTNSSSVISSDKKIPVIDFQNLLLDNSELYESELNKLHSACKEWGFFQLVNHGVSNSLVEKLKQGVEELFKLPIEEKKKLWRKQGDKEGFGDPGVLTDEQILDWKDVLFLFTLPVALRNPHLFPNISPLLRESLEIYSSELAKLAIIIISQMEKALGTKSKEISNLFEDGLQAMSIHCYPPCLQPEQVEGIAPHSDSTGITFLLQLNQVEGFQVKKDGMWVPVKPLPDAFIVNIGDLLEIITNGIYLSNEHRAIVNSTDERMSIATFLNSNEDCEIGPSHSLITQQNPAIYKTMSSKDYIKSMFSREYNGKSHIDAFKL
uniref:Fe2OG dioxygenase domain-containing protein n=1 Tax=Cannabis sativa TaxID=3483 RepID=A0A803NPR1_CANSA